MNKLTGILIVFVLMNACGIIENNRKVPLYETFETEILINDVQGNKFSKFISFSFSKDDRVFNAEGFFNGEDKWCVRFMPDETGEWNYSWQFENKNGSGKFFCVEKSNPKNHGHVKRDPGHERYLVYDDGSPHYWYGGKWINTPNYGPESKGDEKNVDYLTDTEFLNYLDTVEQYRHNGLLLKHALYPLENDKLSWDLKWIQRGEWLVKQMAERGIYCQINFFDTWSRDREKFLTTNTDGSNQVFNVWDSTDYVAKENYIRTLVARYSGFYNVYWELGNEMEHRPNNGATFVKLSNENYIPWIHKYDPYQLPVCLSERIWKQTNVDIGLIHQTDDFPTVVTEGNRPVMINELVRGGINDVLWKDSVMCDPAERISYRRTFWRYFTFGGSGSSEATWLSINKPLNQAALNVMGDQMRLRNFIEKLPVSINEMDTDTAFISKGPGSFRTRGKNGECYVTYFLLDTETSVNGDTVMINTAAGQYEYKWYDPKTGIYTNPEITEIKAAPHSILHPDFTEDLVLLVTRVR